MSDETIAIFDSDSCNLTGDIFPGLQFLQGYILNADLSTIERWLNFFILKIFSISKFIELK